MPGGSAEVHIKQTHSDVNKSLAVALAAGVGTGLAAVYENPVSSFTVAGLQSGVIAGGVSYFMPDYDSAKKAAAVGVGMAVACGGLQGFSSQSCLKFALISGLSAYAGLYFLEPTIEKELNSLRGKK